MSSTETEPADRRRVVLCVGLAVLDQVFAVERFPSPHAKTRATDFTAVNGGGAANAAIAIARLGGTARLAAPLGGPPGQDPATEQILAGLANEGVETGGCLRMDGATAPLSAVLVDASGERIIVNYRDERLAAARVADPAALVAGVDAVVADNRLPEFILPICRAARARNVPVVLDADKPTSRSDELLTAASHVVFSAEGLRATANSDDFEAGLRRVAAATSAFLAATDGPNDMLWLEAGRCLRLPVFTVAAVDTLAAGDVFHGAFALALAEGMPEARAMRFAAATAALKCTRFGGIAGAPQRRDVTEFLAKSGSI